MCHPCQGMGAIHEEGWSGEQQETHSGLVAALALKQVETMGAKPSGCGLKRAVT